MLREAVFNPKTPGTMKIIADMEDSHYYEKRAIELIAESAVCRAVANDSEYHKNIIKAIQLLALADIVNG